jgi:putative salt-induced outer membrane protein YdiY
MGVTEMHRAGRWLVTAAVGIVLSGLAPQSIMAQEEEEEEKGWEFTAELSAIWVGGNSVSNTFGLGSELAREWARSAVSFSGGALRSENTRRSRTAVGTADDFIVNVDEDAEKTAENYFLRGRYDYKFSDRFFSFVSASWLRNTFAGIKAEWVGAAGVGNIWVDSDRIRFSTDYSITLSHRADVVPNPDADDTFAGARFGYDFGAVLTEAAEFTSEFIGDLNLNNTDDVRFDWTNSLPVSISSKLALKPSLQLTWRNDPALETLELFTATGNPTGETVLSPLDKLDTLFTLALVLSL